MDKREKVCIARTYLLSVTVNLEWILYQNENSNLEMTIYKSYHNHIHLVVRQCFLQEKTANSKQKITPRGALKSIFQTVRPTLYKKDTSFGAIRNDVSFSMLCYYA